MGWKYASVAEAQEAIRLKNRETYHEDIEKARAKSRAWRANSRAAFLCGGSIKDSAHTTECDPLVALCGERDHEDNLGTCEV